MYTKEIYTDKREQLIDITERVKECLSESGIANRILTAYAQGAIMIQENWDDSVQTDVVNLLRQLIPKGVWLHDKQDGNGDSHLKGGVSRPI